MSEIELGELAFTKDDCDCFFINIAGCTKGISLKQANAILKEKLAKAPRMLVNPDHGSEMTHECLVVCIQAIRPTQEKGK